MWMCASADRVTLEEEYPALVVFSHLLTPISCIIIRKLHLRSLIFFHKKILKVSPFIICLNKCDCNIEWVHCAFFDFVGPLTFGLNFQPNWSNPPCFHNEHYSNHFLPKNLYGSKTIKSECIFIHFVQEQCWLNS